MTSELVIAIVKSIIAVSTLMSLAALLTWAERKQSAVMQDRIGANRAAILGFRAIGLFHIIADAIKMMTKEDFVPPFANRFIHSLAPFLAIFPAIVAFAAIPMGDTVTLFGHTVEMRLAPMNIGFLFIFAMASVTVYAVVLGGWSSNNRFAMLGAMRAAGQMISYELALGLAVVGSVMVYGTLDLMEIARAQTGLFAGFLPNWGIIYQPLGFLLLITASIAETKRAPFDIPEAESEIIGCFLEYSGMKFGMFFMAEFVTTVVVAGLVSTLYFGGYQVPYLMADGFHLPFGLFLGTPAALVPWLQFGIFWVKVVFFCWLLLTIRWTLPRFRYDQLMHLGWKILLPLALFNIVATGAWILAVS